MSSIRSLKQNNKIQSEARAWLCQLTSGTMTDADVVAFDRWRATSRSHREAFAEANLLWDALEPAARVARVRAGMTHLAEPGPSSRRGFLFGALAACGGTAAVLAFYPPLHLWPRLDELAAEFRTGAGERRRLALGPDATLDLDTRTSLSEIAAAGPESAVELVNGRIAVSLDAMARKGILIRAAGGTIRAARARFDVRREDGTVCVTCGEGRVAVNLRGSVTTLEPSQRLTYRSGVVERVETIDLGVTTAWQHGRMIFQDTPLSQVVDELNRYRPGRIIIMSASLSQRRIVAGFRTDRIDEALTYLSEVLGLKTQALPGGIVLLS